MALPRGAMGFSAVCDWIVVFPDHTHYFLTVSAFYSGYSRGPLVTKCQIKRKSTTTQTRLGFHSVFEMITQAY